MAKKSLGSTKSVADGAPAGLFECAAGVCLSADGKRIEIHLDGSNPECDELTKLIAPKVMLGVPTEYVVDHPEDVEKGPPKGRKP